MALVIMMINNYIEDFGNATYCLKLEVIKIFWPKVSSVRICLQFEFGGWSDCHIT